MIGLRYLPDVTTLKLDVKKCNGCRMCTYVCPHGVFAIEDKKAVLSDINACMECGACAMNCPEVAITVRAGVGCAYGIIMGTIKGTEPTCDCTAETDCC
jgi:NAD-dependent dihydropyrimidine dehydrogenase PreA subunit